MDVFSTDVSAGGTASRHQQFQSLRVVRSDCLWAGLSTDFVIEHVFMRSTKSSGGLTRGKGMTEQQRLVWVMS